MDFKKAYKDLYLPKTTPMLIEVPEMVFVMFNGRGNPNDPQGEYPLALALLYALSYTIKMSKMGSEKIAGYYDYIVPPLEGLWQLPGGKSDGIIDKDALTWISLIRQPEFVTQEVFDWACESVHRKKGLDPAKARLQKMTEGLCVQCMHIGSYDAELETIARMNQFVEAQGLAHDFSESRRHHEIYLSDPRKTDPEKLKTVIRVPVRKA